MNIKPSIPSFLAASLLILASGCGKTETTPPASKDAGTPPVAATAPAKPAEPAAPTAATAVPATPEIPKTAPVETAAPTGVAPAPPAEQAQKSVAQPSASLASLPQDQLVTGLKDALGKGLQQAVANLGHDGGFLTNLNVKIPMPEKLQKAETALRAMKQDKLADDFVVTMNRAAEQAVPEAGAVFVDALKQMNIDDARSILTGANDAATQYFQKTTSTNLYVKFYPIVQQATAKTGVTAAYKKLIEKASPAQSLGGLGSALGNTLFDKDSLDIDAYVTNKTLDGLFKMVAEEEKQIRQNPAARTTDALQKVFGALKL